MLPINTDIHTYVCTPEQEVKLLPLQVLYLAHLMGLGYILNLKEIKIFKDFQGTKTPPLSWTN